MSRHTNLLPISFGKVNNSIDCVLKCVQQKTAVDRAQLLNRIMERYDHWLEAKSLGGIGGNGDVIIDFTGPFPQGKSSMHGLARKISLE